MTNDHKHPFGPWCSECDDEQWGGAERWRHCTHPEQDWCDCDWCRLIRTRADNGAREDGLEVR